jgi:hypothetical protein
MLHRLRKTIDFKGMMILPRKGVQKLVAEAGLACFAEC